MIQFSSGTTGTPKGVCLTHRNILANLAAIEKGMDLVPEDVELVGSPFFHLVPLYVGNNQLHLDTFAFIRYPLLWLESIEKHGATITAAPGFSRALILERLKRQPDKKYNLADLRLLCNGAEPISVDLMTRFMTEMGGHGLKPTAMFPVYGLAEATLAVTFPPLNQTPKIETLSRKRLQSYQQAVISQKDEEVISFVSVGVPVSGCEIRIVGEEGYVGEIQIKGENVTKGYYNCEPAPEWLATGDLGYLRDGWLYVTGRSKDIIFLHGQNYYAHDLENIACQVPGIKLGRVALWGSFDEKLGRDKVLLFLRGEAELFWQVQQHLRRVTGLEIDVMIPLKSFPKTSSGKLQRYKLGQQFAAGEFTQVSQEMAQLLEEVKVQRRQEKIAPRTFTEKLLHRVWCEELLLPPEDMGIEDTFIELGGNSLRMAFVVQKLARQYQVNLDQATWAEYPTIRELAAYLDQRSTIGVKTRTGVFKG